MFALTDRRASPGVLRAFESAQGPGWGVWAPYDLWNDSLVDEFFGGSRAGRPVYLDLEPDTLERLASALGASAGLRASDAVGAFSRSVKETFDLQPSGHPMLEKHLRIAQDWASPDATQPALPGFTVTGDVPPFVATLGLFSLAAERMHAGGGMYASNYYGRLCELLEVDDPDQVDKVQNDFRKHSNRLWAYLNAWLRAAHGARGLPTAEAFDRRVHVGVPISQALVREAERASLPEFFTDYQFNPGQRFLRARTCERSSRRGCPIRSSPT